MPRAQHTATLLRTGKVLLAGGVSNQEFPLNGSGTPLATADIYDPATNTATATGHMVVPRDSSAAARLANGWVLMVGGCSGVSGHCAGSYTATSEFYIP